MVSPDIEQDVVYYLFASQFGIPPREVDQMDWDQISTMIHLHTMVKERESKELERAKNG